MPDFDALEKEVQQDRERLAASLDKLSHTIAPDNVKTQIAAAAESYGGEIGRQAWTAARENPAAFALVGVGLGLLLTGTGTRPERPDQLERPPTQDPAFADFDARVAVADTDMKKEMTGMTDTTSRAARLRAALDKGLDKLPAGSRERVVKARKAALRAQEKLESQAERVARKSRTFAHDQPLAVGALALGVGALVGALLPGTRREDELLGAQRDALMEDARRVLSEEMEKLHDAASDRLEESRHSA